MEKIELNFTDTWEIKFDLPKDVFEKEYKEKYEQLRDSGDGWGLNELISEMQNDESASSVEEWKHGEVFSHGDV